MIRSLKRVHAGVLMLLALLLPFNNAAMANTQVHAPSSVVAQMSESFTHAPSSTKHVVHVTPRVSLVPIAAHLHTTEPLDTTSSLETLLASVTLGTSLRTLQTHIGDPYFVARENTYWYWAYSVDNGHAWLVVASSPKGTIESLQVLPRADTSSSMHDLHGMQFGQKLDARNLPAHTFLAAYEHGQPHRVTSSQSMKRFYALGRHGELERIGMSIGDMTLPLIVRWYRYDGESASRAVEFSAYHNMGEAAYVRTTPDRYIPCYGGNHWNIIGTRQFLYAGVTVDEARLQCGDTQLRRAMYFNRTTQPIHEFDADPIAQRMLTGTASAAATVSAVASYELQPASKSHAIHVNSTTGQIWFTTPYATHCTYNNATCDVLLAYIDDPLNPLTSVTLTPTFSSYLTHEKKNAKVSKPLVTLSCGFSGGFVKCYPPEAVTGSPSFSGTGNFSGNNVSAGSTNLTSTNDPSNNPPGSQASSNTNAGDPVNIVSGALTYQQEDFQLSGPDPMSFFHRYQSTLAQGAVSGGPAQQPPTDLGVGWRHTYDAYIDLTLSTSGFLTLNRNDGGQVYFQTPTDGSSATSYDPNTGDQLTTNTGGTFTLLTWDHQTMQFDATGFLTSITDRIGNTQTIVRNTDHTIASVTDVLGRSLSFSYDTSHRIIGVTSSPSGISLVFTYDTGTNCYTGQLCTAQESDGKIWTYEYYNPTSNNGVSLLEYVIDPLGHTKQYNQYSQLNLGTGDNHYRVTQQQRDSGNETRNFAYTYGTTTVTDTLGSSHTTNYTWAPLLQQVLSVSGPLCNCHGNQLQYTYDVVGRKVTILEGSGSGVVTHRMSYGRDVIFTSPNGVTTYPSAIYPGPTSIARTGLATTSGTATSTTSLAYYPLGDARQDLVQTITEPSVDTPGNVVTTTNTYATTGLLTAQSRQGYINGTSTTYSTSAAYDSKGRVTSTTGPRTDVTQTTTYGYYPDTDTDYARRGQLETITDPASHTTNFATAASPYNTYTIYGGPKSVTDQNSVVTDLTYDARGRTLTSTLKGVTGDPADLVTTYTYDANGRVTSLSKPLGNGQTYVYDSNNNLTKTILTDASGKQYDQTVGTFDTMDRLTAHTVQSCTTPATSCSAWTTQYSDIVGYTNLDQQQNVTYPTGGATTYAYDGAGNVAAQTVGDTNYAVTDTYTSDAQHQSIQHTLGGSTLSFASDLQFNHAVTAPSNASSTSYQYDDFGRIEKRVSPFSGTTTYSYDPAGNLTSTTDGNNATTATTYDVLNRPLVATSTRSGYTTETVTDVYDDTTSGHFGIGRIKSMTDPSGSTTYTYERRGKIATQVQIANSTTYTTDYTYDGNGNRATITLPSTRVLTYTYDYADRPKSVVSGTTTYVSSATYEPFGPLAQLVFGNGTTQTKSYNQRYLLTENKLTHSTTTLSDVTYTENATGYITQATDALNAGYNELFQYGGRATNMLTNVNTGASLWGSAQYADTYNQNLSSIEFPSDNYGLTYSRAGLLTNLYNSDSGTSQAVTYDGAGNELSVGTSNYTYSTRNHLSSGDGVTYTYDGLGRRVSATATAGTRTSLYDPEMHLQTESGLSSGSIAYDYIWFDGIPVAQEDIGGNTHWTATDYRNTPFIQTTSAGAVYWQADYAPFGAVYALRTSDAHQPLRMPGQEAEEFTTGNANGLTPRFYNGFRWYRPLLGRYTQSDGLEYGSDSYNLYTYAQNNPIYYADPLGLFQVTVGGGGALITPVFGGSVNAGVVFNIDGSNSSIGIQVQANGGLGGGAFISVGPSISFSNTSDPASGFAGSVSDYAEADGGYFYTLNGSVTGNSDGSLTPSGGVALRGGPGGGLGAFAGKSLNGSYTFPSIGSIGNALGLGNNNNGNGNNNGQGSGSNNGGGGC